LESIRYYQLDLEVNGAMTRSEKSQVNETLNFRCVKVSKLTDHRQLALLLVLAVNGLFPAAYASAVASEKTQNKVAGEVASASTEKTASKQSSKETYVDQAPTAASTAGNTEARASHLLKGTVTATPSPLLSGTVQSIPKGTKVNLSVMGTLNSEFSQQGDDVFAKISCNVANGKTVVMPGGWYMHGTVTNIAAQKRLGRDGYVEVQFDKIISPDGEIELPFKATVSTKDNQLKAVAKTVLIDSGYVSLGALGGSILSVQMTGLPVAIATHGISVGAGAAVGGTLGLIGALKRKGNIASFLPGDEMKMVTAEPIELPGFDPELLPSARVPMSTPNLTLAIKKPIFARDPLGDKLSRQLHMDVTIDNATPNQYSFFDLAVISDHDQRYYPSLTNDFQAIKKKVPSHTQATQHLVFSVDSPKHKYWLILLNKANRDEIARTAIN
jgi:hypothetical protein